ncbi:MAG: SPFH domain-containing protein [Candidatus Brocadiales bacterium]|nr:SPFH domain-containing protein [Candidatus Brocadiales bacterium]
MQKDFEGRRKLKRRIPVKWIIIISAVVVCLGVASFFIIRNLGYIVVEPDEVGIVVNNLTGNVRGIDRAGVIIYIPILQEVYMLDKKEQVLQMSSENITPEYPKGNPLWVKSIDGGDVSLDLLIRYVMVPNKADFVIQDSGIGDKYKEKWAVDYIRAVLRYNMGELLIEDFPNSAKRDRKAQQAIKEINDVIETRGIKVTAINVLDYRYYQEYWEKILARRLADKEVEVQIDRAEAARENRRRVQIEEGRRVDTEVSRFRGDLNRRELEIDAKAEQVRRDADAYNRKVTIEGDAEFERLRQESIAILAEKKAEAGGILALRRALEREGGRQLVKFEYAKRLKEATVQGTPVLKANQEIPQLLREKELKIERPAAAAGEIR